MDTQRRGGFLLVLETRVITTGNSELDIKLAGGIPVPSLIVVEGEHGSGKTVLIQQFIHGALLSGLRTTVITTEATTIGYVRQMIGVGFDVLNHYLNGSLIVYSSRIPRIKWVESTGRTLLELVQNHIIRSVNKYDVYVIDSFTTLIKGASAENVSNFLTIVKKLVDRGKTFILSIHPEGLDKETYLFLKAIADGYMELRNVEMGGRLMKALNIIKLKGAPTAYNTTITFEVDPAFGIKLVPMALAKV
ncbi:MAG: ATPase domain-containing protein [Desulfurococcaceae archaeon]